MFYYIVGQSVLILYTMFYLNAGNDNIGYVTYIHAAFHKALSRYYLRKTDDIDIVLLHIYWSTCAKNYQNTAWFDKVIAKIKWCSFFTQSVVTDKLIMKQYQTENNKCMKYMFTGQYQTS